jgi:hypothetical protein
MGVTRLKPAAPFLLLTLSPFLKRGIGPGGGDV